MLNEKRIKEAEGNVRQYLDEQLLRKEQLNPIVFKVLLNNSEESLKIANLLHSENQSYLWTIVTAYYSMYYLANAVLYTSGFKVGDKISHKVTADAFIVFIRAKLKSSIINSYEEIKEEALAGIKADNLASSPDFERRKRGTIQYQTTEEIKRTKAETSLERAKEFSLEVRKLLD